MSKVKLERKTYTDFPLAECIARVRELLAQFPTAGVYQRWTCGGCGARVTGNNRNTLTRYGHHEDCGHITDIAQTGCNYSVHMQLPI